MNYAPTYWYYPDLDEATDAYTFNGDTQVDKFDINYSIAYAKGETRSRRIIMNFPTTEFDLSDDNLVNPQAIDPVEGVVLSIFPERTNNSVPIPLLSEQGFTLLNDPASIPLSSISDITETGENERFSAELSTKYNLDSGILRTLEVGGAIELSEFRNPPTPTDLGYRNESGDMSLVDFGITYEVPALGPIGVQNAYNFIDRATLKSFLFGGIQSLAADEGSGIVVDVDENNPLVLQANTKEDEISAYFQAELQIGRLQVIPGVRLSRFDIQTRNQQRFWLFN